MSLVKNVDDVLMLLARRKMLVLVVAIICTVIASVVITAKPKIYRAYAAIQVEGPQVQAGGQGSPTNNSAQIMQSIEHRLLTRENLLLLIDRHGLQALEPGKKPDELVSDLRSAIKITTTSGAMDAFGQTSISAIVVSVASGDGETSARLSNDLAQSILDMSNEGTNSRARDTRNFFAGEEERIRTEIVSREAELADYQNKNADSLPELSEVRRTELQTLESEQRKLEQELLETTAETNRLEAQDTLRETDRRQLETLAATATLIEDKIAFSKSRRAELQKTLQVMPEVEQTIAAQKRELLLLQDRYASVSQNLADAETALFLAERQQSERFRLLDRAITPEYASGMGYRKQILAAALGSLVVGVLAAVAMELAFPVVRSSAQLERAVGMSALGTIPTVPSLARRGPRNSRLMRAEIYFWNLLALAAIAAIVLMLYERMR